MNMIAIYIAAATAEIGGCFAFWTWLRLGTLALVGHRGNVEPCYLWPTTDTLRRHICGDVPTRPTAASISPLLWYGSSSSSALFPIAGI